jgi:hypothetical protein
LGIKDTTNVFIALKIAFMLSKTDVMVLWKDGAAVVVLGAAGLPVEFCPWTIEEKTLKKFPKMLTKLTKIQASDRCDCKKKN